MRIYRPWVCSPLFEREGTGVSYPRTDPFPYTTHL